VQLTHHRRIAVDGVDTFYREAGPTDAPVVLLPHGYPCSSYEFRALIPRLADRWRLLAPDFPGCGYSATPEDFPYDFDGYAEFLHGFCRALHVTRVAVWLHDFGSQIGLRLAITRPELIAAVIVQNGDIYEDTLGPGYAPLRRYWNDPSQRQYAALHAAVSEHGYRDEFINELRPELAETIPPDLWQLHWSLTTQHRRQIYTDVIAGLRENLAWFPPVPSLAPRTSTAGPHRLGPPRPLHARPSRSRIPTGPTQRRTTPLRRRRPLAPRDPP
jgi:pimeloyl-ACP methyl ester carboxylesterase